MLQQILLESCYQSLIHLGDLSRYRETELRSKDRNWGPAKGYYDLARALKPGSGVSFNALAVLALADEDHFRTLYYLYRAVSVPEPPEMAPKNLELECRKILDRHAKQRLISSVQDGSAFSISQTEFIIFHARCYKGSNLEDYDDAKMEALSQLSNDLVEGPVDGGLNKFCLINIAAVAHTKRELRGMVHFRCFYAISTCC